MSDQTDARPNPEQVKAFQSDFELVRKEIAKAVVGHQEIVDGVVTCLFAGGHALLEGVPGLGKTLLVRSLSEALQLQFNRIQFTPDLMPADVTGTTIVVEGDDHDRCQRGHQQRRQEADEHEHPWRSLR